MTHEHEIAARAALTDLLAYHRTNITRIEQALAALDGDDVPATPMVIDVPVVLPTSPKREQRPAVAKEEHRSTAMQALAAQRATCPDCGKEFSRLGLGPHRRAAHGKVVEHQAEVPHAATQQTFRCATCTAVFPEKGLLSAHTINSHKRGPLQAELVALDDEVAA